MIEDQTGHATKAARSVNVIERGFVFMVMIIMNCIDFPQVVKLQIAACVLASVSICTEGDWYK